MKISKLIIAAILIAFSGIVYYQLRNFTKISDHVHSVDDKQSEQRTDEDNIIIFERILQKQPDDINAMFQLSELYLKTGQKGKSRDMLESILDIDPSNKKAMEKLKQLN